MNWSQSCWGNVRDGEEELAEMGEETESSSLSHLTQPEPKQVSPDSERSTPKRRRSMEKNLKIGMLLGLGLGLLLGLVVGAGASSYRGENGNLHATSATLQGEAKLVEQAARVQSDIQVLRRQAKSLLLRTDSLEKIAESRKKWDEQLAFQVARLNEMEKYATRTQDKELVRVMRTELATYDAGFTKVLGLIQDGKIQTASNAKRSI
jgi:hypothetical protein